MIITLGPWGGLPSDPAPMERARRWLPALIASGSDPLTFGCGAGKGQRRFRRNKSELQRQNLLVQTIHEQMKCEHRVHRAQPPPRSPYLTFFVAAYLKYTLE